MKWLDNDLIAEVKKVFESKYKRDLSLSEIKEIAENLTEGMESIVKYKYQNEYGRILPN